MTTCPQCSAGLTADRLADHLRYVHPKQMSAEPPVVKRCDFCADEFTPRLRRQRFCSSLCREKCWHWGRVRPDGPTPLEPEERAARNMRTALVVSAWSLVQRQQRAWNAWVDCLGLPEEMKETT